jgi:hypothetical protein
MRFDVSPLLNIAQDAEGRPLGFFGYQPQHTVAHDGRLLFTVEAEDPMGALNKAWEIGNRQGADVEGRRWPSEVRSLSVGDVVYVGSEVRKFWAVARVGWMPVGAPDTEYGEKALIDGGAACAREVREPDVPCGSYEDYGVDGRCYCGFTYDEHKEA